MIDNSLNEIKTLVRDLDKDRYWILENIDRGCWPDCRLELAALERDLGQLLIRAEEYLEDAIERG